MCRIHYYAVDDYMAREEKLELLSKLGSIDNPAIKWQEITPNDRGDWINQRADAFDILAPLVPEKKEDEAAQAVFATIAIGIATNRDDWVCGYCKSKTADNMKRTIAEYERQRKEKVLTMDSAKISWTRALKRDFANNTEHRFNSGAFRTVMYRPFCKEHLYYDRPFIESPGIWSRLFPTPDTENLVICVEGTGSSKDFGCLMADMIPDLGYGGIHTQCFPLHYYTEDAALKKGERDLPYDDTTHYPLPTNHYITKEDVFYYVYGFLHSPEYREEFKADLKKSLPRIPLVEKAEDFWAFSRAGRELAELHLHYEDVVNSGHEKTLPSKCRIAAIDAGTCVFHNIVLYCL